MSMRKTMAVGVAVLGMLAVAARAESQAVSLSVRTHQDRELFPEYPFGEGDLSYMIAWETHTDEALIQLGADVCPTFQDNEAVDYAASPTLNLIFKDRLFRGGLGVLSTYTVGEDESDWMDLYWQFLLGFSFELPARLSADVYAIYPFKDWGSLSDFEMEDIEFSAGLAWHF